MSNQKLGEASLILAAGTIAVNVFQVLKLILISRMFGAMTGLLDPYVVALRIPLAVQGVILGTLQLSFIPTYVGHLARGEKDRADRVLGSTLSFGVVFYSLFCAIMAIWAEPILRPFTPDFDPVRFAQAVSLFRILLVMLLLNGLVDLVTAFYYGNQRYFLPSVVPVIGIAISVGYLLLFPEQGVYNLAYGLILAGAVQLLLLFWGTRKGRAGFRLHASRHFISSECAPIYRMMLPVAGGLLLANANQLIDVGVAARLEQGAVTILDFATRFHDVIMKLFAASVGGALLPFLSQYIAQERFGEFRNTLSLGTRLSALMLFPCAIIIFLFGTEAISAMLQGGRFTASDAIQVGTVWAAYSAGLFAITDAIFKARGLVAIGDLRPLWLTVAVCIPLNIVLDVMLARLIGVSGIAIGTGIVYLIYLLVYRWRLALYYKRTGATPPGRSPMWRTLAAITVFAVLAFAVREAVNSLVQVVPSPSSDVRTWALVTIAVSVAALGGIYLALLRWFRVEEAATLFRFFKRLVQRG